MPLTHLLNRIALKWASERRAPDLIPLSGDERLAARDYFSVYLAGTEGHSYLVDGMHAAGAVAREFDGETYSFPTNLDWNQVASLRLEIIHYYKRQEYRFTSAMHFLASQIAARHRLLAGFDHAAQRLFNTRRLVRADRVRLLSTLAELATEEGRESMSALMPLHAANSSRIARHPDLRRSLAHLRLHLEALVQTQDVSRDEHISYRLTPKGLTTLSQHAEQERRHADMRRLQFAASAFAAVTALGVLFKTEQIQAFATCLWLTGKQWLAALVGTG